MLLLVALLGCSPQPAAEPSPQAPPPTPPTEIAVFAAASLTDVLPEVTAKWTATTGHTATFTFDSTSRLAKQVEAGAAADVFFSADTEWMTWLSERHLVRDDTRVDRLSNDLVVVVPSTSTLVVTQATDLSGVTRIGLAGESVPAGKYGRAALTHAGIWDGVAPRVVSGDSVRTVLGWVSAGEVDAGIVYATDARIDPGVRVAFTFPPESHPPIVYPVAVTAGAPHADVAALWVAYLDTPEARASFEAAGFGVLGP